MHYHRIGVVLCFVTFISVLESKQLPRETSSEEEPHVSLRRIKQLPQVGFGRKSSDEPSSLTLDVTPQNTALYVGGDVTLTCAASPDSDFRVQWWEFAYSPNGNLVSDNDVIGIHPEAARYSIIQPTNSTFNLKISTVKLSDGGSYLCEDVNTGPPNPYRGGAQLITIDEEPTCSTTIPNDGIVVEGENHTAECLIKFKGNIVPTQTWFGQPPFDVDSVIGPDNIRSTISWNVTRAMNVKAFTCVNNFTDNFTPVPEDMSSNVPDWNYVYPTRQQFVYWGPKNMYTVPDDFFYKPGDFINCVADSNPVSSYQWENTRTGQNFSGPTIAITEDLYGTTQIFTCTAQNTIRGTVYTDSISINVTVEDHPAQSTIQPPANTGADITDFTGTIATTPMVTIGSTTTPSPTSCNDLTGRWQSQVATKATLCITINNDQNGMANGIFRNNTDTYWIEVIGRTKENSFDQIGLTGIWPGTVGVSSFVGECHRCTGTETLLINSIQRTKGTGTCGVSGPLYYSAQYTFYRVGPTCA